MDRIESLISELTLEEKVSILSGSTAWHTTGVPRLNIPRVKMTDGPIGCLLYTSPSPRDYAASRMPSSA